MPRFSRLRFAALGLAAGGTLGLAFAEQVPNLTPPTAIPKEMTSYRDIVKRAMPAVVSLESRSTARKLGTATAQPQLPPGVPDEFRRFFEQMPQQQMPQQQMPQQQMPSDGILGSGSGVIVDASGTILTNAHVVAGADSIEVTLHDGRKFTATDIRRDPKTDLAVIKITTDKPLPFLEFADSDQYEVGDRILAIGAPFGLSGTVTQGIISAKGRNAMHINQYEDFLQIDAAINPGNSGGPLLTLDGRIVGINSAIKSKSGGFQGIGLAISSNMAKEVSKQLQTTGVVKRGYLGVGIRDLDLKIAGRLGASDGGVLITKVYDNTPAAKAGLQSGDVIVSIGGVAVKEASVLPRTVIKMPLGTPSEIVFLRDGKSITQSITIEEQPAEYGSERPSLNSVPMQPSPKANDLGAGITVTELNDASSAQFGFSKGMKGVVIASVEPGSAAATAGLAKGLMIRKIDGVAVTTAQDAKDAFAAASKEKGALLQVMRPTGEVDFVVVAVK